MTSAVTVSPSPKLTVVRVAVGLVTLDLDAGADVDAALLEALRDDVGGVLVAPGEDLREELEDRDLHAEIGEAGRELAADRAAAHDHRGLRQSVERQDLVGGEHEAPVDVEAGQRARDGPGAQQHVRACELGAVVDLDDVACGQAPRTRDRGDLALLHQAGEALPQLVDHLLLAGLARGEVDAGLIGDHAEVLGVADGAEHRRRLEVLLGRDAATVQARAAHLVLLDDGHLEARRRAVEGGAVSAGTAADDHEVELFAATGRAYAAVSGPRSGPGP